MGKKARNRSSRRYHDDNVVNMDYHNQQAQINGPDKKSWSIHDLRAIRPLTQKQEDMFTYWFQGDNVCAHGSAGTGKTFLALYLAMSELLEYKEHQQIIIVRSAVAAREIGHLPGSKEEKEEVFEMPYIDICSDLFGRKSTYADMKTAGIVKFMSTSHIRGLTWDNSIVIVDECQNMNFEEINSVMTRLGKNTKVIVCGDHKRQCDLKRYEETGIQKTINAFDDMSGFSNIEFNFEDVVRSGVVKDWLKATDQV